MEVVIKQQDWEAGFAEREWGSVMKRMGVLRVSGSFELVGVRVCKPAPRTLGLMLVWWAGTAIVLHLMAVLLLLTREPQQGCVTLFLVVIQTKKEDLGNYLNDCLSTYNKDVLLLRNITPEPSRGIFASRLPLIRPVHPPSNYSFTVAFKQNAIRASQIISLGNLLK